MNINFFNILIISGIINGILFSIIILSHRRYKSKPSSYLALVVLFLSLHNLYYWFGDTNLNTNISYYDHLYIPWNLLILPMYYFFVQAYLQKDEKNKRYFLAPFFISLSIHISLLINAFVSETTPGEYNTFTYVFYYTEEYFSSAFPVFVIVKTFYLIKENKKHDTFSINKVQIETKWLKKLLVFGIIICSFWLSLTIYSQFISIGQLNTGLRYFVWVSISILVYWLGYLGVHHNLIFNQRKRMRKRLIHIDSTTSLAENPKIDKIKNLIENEKLFLNPNLGISDVSKKLELSETYFSSIFNQNSTNNFSNYINKLRVNEAKKLLINEEYKNYTVISIGLEAGFNSKSVFYTVFKKSTGITPSEYRKKKMS